MELRHFVIGISGAAIAGFVFFFMYALERDHLESELVKEKNRLKLILSEQESAEQRKDRVLKRLEELKRKVVESDKLRQANDEEQSIVQKKLENAQTELKKVREQSMVAKFRRTNAIERNRAIAVGSVYPKIVLVNGTELINARLTRFTTTSLSFSHRQGKSEVWWSLLPDNLIEQFDLGRDAIAIGQTIEDDMAKNTSADIQKVSMRKKGSDAEINSTNRRIHQTQVQLMQIDNEIESLSKRAAPNPSKIGQLKNQKNSLQQHMRNMQQKLDDLTSFVE